MANRRLTGFKHIGDGFDCSDKEAPSLEAPPKNVHITLPTRHQKAAATRAKNRRAAEAKQLEEATHVLGQSYELRELTDIQS
jgi:hypothetical protein